MWLFFPSGRQVFLLVLGFFFRHAGRYRVQEFRGRQAARRAWPPRGTVSRPLKLRGGARILSGLAWPPTSTTLSTFGLWQLGFAGVGRRVSSQWGQWGHAWVEAVRRGPEDVLADGGPSRFLWWRSPDIFFFFFFFLPSPPCFWRGGGEFWRKAVCRSWSSRRRCRCNPVQAI